MSRRALVTGGSGYFGSLLVAELLARGYAVRSLDVNDAEDRPADVELVQGDVRDADTVARAVRGIDIVFHNVAQVPLAHDRDLFESVNVGGTGVLLEASLLAGVAKVVHTSSSAVYGVPEALPVTESTPATPREAYGRAKLEAEQLCRAMTTRGLDVSIIRPRTILGHGRLGIFAILFEWMADGADVVVFGRGDNRYQFVHAADLADATIRAGERAGSESYNVGAQEFGTMRDALEGLAEHAGTGVHVRSLPLRPAMAAMQVSARVGVTPFAPYHWIMYGESMYFDTTKTAAELGWSSKFSNHDMFVESYEWFLANRHSIAGGGSHHRSGVKAGVLAPAKKAMQLLSRLG